MSDAPPSTTASSSSSARAGTAEPDQTVRQLRDSIHGHAAAGVEVVRGTRPALLDASGARALSAVFLAGFMLAAAILRDQIASAQLDLLTLLLRTAAFAFCLRALILVGRFALRLREDVHASKHALAFSDAGLLWQSPDGERILRREHVVALCVPSVRASRLLPQPWRPLLVVTRPQAGALYWSIPPYFSASPEVLMARLERSFRLAGDSDAATVRPPPEQPAEARYLEAAEGRPGRDDTVIPEGYGYRLRGPYGVVLGVAFALDALRAAGPQRSVLLQPVFLSCLIALAMPLGWLWFMRRRAKARLGIAMLLTPEELIVRGTRGVVSLPYHQLVDVEVRLKDLWSPFVGTYTARSLQLTAHDGGSMSFDAGFLGAPVEVVAELCAAYRSGRVSATATQADDRGAPDRA